MENLTEIVTPSGHKAYVKPRLTYAEYRAVQRTLTSDYEIDPATKKIKYYGNAIYKSQDLAVKFLVQKIIDKDGKEYTGENILTVIGSWEVVDGEYLYTEIDKLSKASGIPTDVKKN